MRNTIQWKQLPRTLSFELYVWKKQLTKKLVTTIYKSAGPNLLSLRLSLWLKLQQAQVQNNRYLNNREENSQREYV